MVLKAFFIVNVLSNSFIAYYMVPIVRRNIFKHFLHYRRVVDLIKTRVWLIDLSWNPLYRSLLHDAIHAIILFIAPSNHAIGRIGIQTLTHFPIKRIVPALSPPLRHFPLYGIKLTAIQVISALVLLGYYLFQLLLHDLFGFVVFRFGVLRNRQIVEHLGGVVVLL